MQTQNTHENKNTVRPEFFISDLQTLLHKKTLISKIIILFLIHQL